MPPLNFKVPPIVQGTLGELPVVIPIIAEVPTVPQQAPNLPGPPPAHWAKLIQHAPSAPAALPPPPPASIMPVESMLSETSTITEHSSDQKHAFLLPPPVTIGNPESNRKGAPRKYDFGDVTDIEYKRLSALENQRKQRAKRKISRTGNDVIVTAADLSAHTPWIPTPNEECQIAYTIYANANEAWRKGIAQFKLWAHEEGIRVENLRCAYMSAAHRDRYKKDPT